MLPKSSLHKLRRKLNKKEIKDHFQRNKTRYLVGGAFVVGVAVGFAIYHYKVAPVKINTGNPVSYSSKIGTVKAAENSKVIVNIVQGTDNVVKFGGRQTKIVECIETGEIFKKVKEAAEAAGVDAYNMSKHINGKGSDKIFGQTYRIVGLGTCSV